MAKTGWKKKLGTSKREQGIVTPRAPQNRPKKPIRKLFPGMSSKQAVKQKVGFLDRAIKAVSRLNVFKRRIESRSLRS